jgi:hypothetical protein
MALSPRQRETLDVDLMALTGVVRHILLVYDDAMEDETSDMEALDKADAAAMYIEQAIEKLKEALR